MIALKFMRRFSRLEEEYGKLWRELETPLPSEMTYKRSLARLEKHFEEKGLHEELATLRKNRTPCKRR